MKAVFAILFLALVATVMAGYYYPYHGGHYYGAHYGGYPYGHFYNYRHTPYYSGLRYYGSYGYPHHF